MDHTTFYIGGKFPLEVPFGTEGANFEILGDKKAFVVHTPEATQEEIDAFNSGVDKIGVYLHSARIPVMFLVIKFRDGKFTSAEGSMNTRLLSNKVLKENFYKLEGDYNNLLLMFLLDNNIIKGIRTIGLSNEIMDALSEGTQRQQKISYTENEYFAEMQVVWKMHTIDELLERSRAVQRF